MADPPQPQTTATAADEPDPVVASYSVFLKPDLPTSQRLLILQHPNVSDAAGRANPPPPTELRIKPGVGMVEVDVPLDHSFAYDRDKGQRWGGVLARSVQAKAGGSLGLAGGFGVGAPPPRPQGGRSSRAAANSAGDDDMSLEWSEAVRQDRVLRTQTLGGMAAGPGQKEARYMVGVFQGKTVHLTPVTSAVHLRPQLHHIDAAAEADRNKPRDPSSSAPAPTGGGGNGPGGREGPARAIHMTIKSTGDGTGTDSDVVTETMADRLRAVQTAGWQRMAYHADDTDAAWAVYEDALILRGAAASSDAKGKDKGKGREGDDDEKPAKEDADADADGAAAAAALSAKFGGLRTDWGEEDTLRAVSGMQRPAVHVDVDSDEPGKKATGVKKGKAPAARAAPKRTTRAKAGTAMEVD